MPKLPKIARDRIANEMYEIAAWAKRTQPRHYLGMSEIGKACTRELWFNFRGYSPLPVEGRIIMLFRLGDRIEDEVIRWMKKAGYKINNRQASFNDHGGLFRGHCDGIINGVTQCPHILEIKSANDQKFNAFRKAGVRQIYPVYEAQVQCYMGYAGLDRTLFVIQNKNDSRIYTERLYFKKTRFQELRQKAFNIITANDPPSPPFEQFSITCEWCGQRVHCWNPAEAIIENKVCGTCRYLRLQGLKKTCLHIKHQFEVKRWGLGCPGWLGP